MLKLNDRIVYIHNMNLRSLDLNLLVVFDALMRERHVTRAAQSIGLSQPAFSNALTRLRDRLKDELFIRSPDGMKPTAWALELSGPVSLALSEIETALDGAAFDPSTSTRAFTIATLDYATLTIFPPLLEKIRQEAPGVTIRVIKPSLFPGEYLDTQETDIALLNWDAPPERFISETLIEEDWVCVVRSGHPLANQPISSEAYAGEEHLVINPKGDATGWADTALTELGLKRHIALVMPTYGPTALILETTDLVLTCPKSIGRIMSETAGTTVLDCPLTAPFNMQSLNMIWHSRLGHHPATTWLRGILRDVAGNIA
ncbi:LysR family transcriptional regulator [Hellea sp.]|nr:LysR family transcriptional regulator [Hellea sp.]